MKRRMTLVGGVVLAGLAWFAAGSAAAADFVFLGFGDSVTRSDGCPVDCSGQFDEARLGGYVGRLDRRLGAGYRVENHGVGGETTGQGVSRIGDVLDGGGDVLLLMEGTNDIYMGFSTESIKTNLGAMTNKATRRGIDTVLASTIRKINLPGHGPTSDLRGAIDDLASEKKRDFVNPFGPLCPILACFDQHYYQPDQEIGHIDASGYEIMTDLFEDAIRADSTPGRPTTVAPEGEINFDTPTYEWSDLSSANWYQVQVDDADGRTILDEMVDASTECSGSTCTLAPSDALDGGEYEWRVRARNLIAYGSWSRWTPFTVALTRPGPVTLIAPSGDFYSASPLNFEFEWNEAADTDEYRLRVEDATGGVPIQELYPAGVCDGEGVCGAMPATALGAGSYLWKVRGLNGVGTGAWSPELAIAIYSTPPARVPAIFPEGPTYIDQPTYRWGAVPGAPTYRLQVDEVGGGTVLARTYSDANCDAGLCAVTPMETLPPGSYKWRVRGSNPLGDGAWAAFTFFDVLPCIGPMNRIVEAQTITSDETFTACVRLTIASGVRVEAGTTVTFHAGEVVLIEDDIEVDAGAEAIVRVDP